MGRWYYLETSTTRPAAQKSFNPIKWLSRLDVDFRQAHKLKNADDARLQDMGLTRDQANTAFYGRFGQHRYFSKAR